MEFFEGRPWVTAVILFEDADQLVEHGEYDGHTLCGIPKERYQRYRHPFFGSGGKDCPDCAARLRELDEEYRDANP